MRKLRHQILQLYWEREGNGRMLEGSESPGGLSAGAQSCRTQLSVSANGRRREQGVPQWLISSLAELGWGRGQC